jgi:TRAP-type C4-dicarboxylate transport system substrate-binding protein
MARAVQEAVAYQRQLAVEEHEESMKALEAAGCEIVEADHASFVAAVQPLLDDARKTYGEAMFRMAPKA